MSDNNVIDGIYVGFHITYSDLYFIGIFLGLGFGVGAVGALGILQLLGSIVKRAQAWWKRRNES